MNVLAIILLILFLVTMIGSSIFAIVTNFYSTSFKEIKKLVKQNKDIDPFYVKYCYNREKSKVEKLLEEHNYKLIEKKIKEEKLIYGCGKIEFADGRCEYQVHFSENWFSPVDEEEYNSLKKELGKKVTFVHEETVYTNKETE